MSPQEKAKQLIEEFSKYVNQWNWYHDQPRDSDSIIKDAKECALVMVNQMILDSEFDAIEIDHKRIMDKINYLDQLKIEILKY